MLPNLNFIRATALVAGVIVATVSSGAQAYTINFDTLISGALANSDPTAAAHGVTFSSAFQTEDLDSFGDPIPGQFHWEVYRNPDNTESFPITVANPADFGRGAAPSPLLALNTLFDQVMIRFSSPTVLTGFGAELDHSSFGDLFEMNVLLLDENGKAISTLPGFVPSGTTVLDYSFAPIIVSAVLIPSGSKFYDNINITEAAVAETPVPAALPLFASGLGALGLVAYRRKRKAAQAA